MTEFISILLLAETDLGVFIIFKALIIHKYHCEGLHRSGSKNYIKKKDLENNLMKKSEKQ